MIILVLSILGAFVAIHIAYTSWRELEMEQQSTNPAARTTDLLKSVFGK